MKRNQLQVKAEIKALINQFGNKSGLVRSKARESLKEFGHTAVDYLSELLIDKRKIVRWEAIKTLTEISDPHSASLFIFALNDEESDVRWVAAEGLISLGKQGVVTTLEGLISNFNSVYFRNGVHHILKEYSKEHPSPELKKLLSALLKADTGYYMPAIVLKFIRKLRSEDDINN
jgi:hypothetical protein